MYLGPDNHYAVMIDGGARDGMIILDELTFEEALDYACGLRLYDGEIALVYDKADDIASMPRR